MTDRQRGAPFGWTREDGVVPDGGLTGRGVAPRKNALSTEAKISAESVGRGEWVGLSPFGSVVRNEAVTAAQYDRLKKGKGKELDRVLGLNEDTYRRLPDNREAAPKVHTATIRFDQRVACAEGQRQQPTAHRESAVRSESGAASEETESRFSAAARWCTRRS